MERRIDPDPGACFLLALMLLILPLPWLAGAVTAAAVHELCHILAVLLCSGSIRGFHMDASGAVLLAGTMKRRNALICTLAGPAGSLLLSALYPWFPRTSLCALVQGLFNLLPVYPLDGGRIARLLAGWLLPPEAADSVCRGIKYGTAAILFMLAWVAAFRYRLGFSPVFAAAFLLLRLFRKNSLQTGASGGTIRLPINMR